LRAFQFIQNTEIMLWAGGIGLGKLGNGKMGWCQLRVIDLSIYIQRHIQIYTETFTAKSLIGGLSATMRNAHTFN